MEVLDSVKIGSRGLALVRDEIAGPLQPDVSAATYTPKSGDVGRCLRASVTYTDAIAGNGPADHDQDGDADGLQRVLVSERNIQRSDPANCQTPGTMYQ